MSVLRFASATTWMLPPRPPSPPSGPPRGTNFSRRKEALPSPPLPAITSMRASSKNFTVRPSRDGRRAGGEHFVGRLVEDRCDALDPVEVLRLHQHRAQAGDRLRPGAIVRFVVIEERDGQFGEGQVQPAAGARF